MLVIWLRIGCDRIMGRVRFSRCQCARDRIATKKHAAVHKVDRPHECCRSSSMGAPAERAPALHEPDPVVCALQTHDCSCLARSCR